MKFAEVTFRASETHFVLKFRLSTQISPDAAPATTSHTPTSPNAAHATEVTLQDHQMLRLPRKVTVQDHQILRLPRKMTLMIEPARTNEM